MRLALDGVKETVKIVAAERQKRIKLVRIFQGIKDGMFGRTGKTHLS
jgi:hypothetical protein